MRTDAVRGVIFDLGGTLVYRSGVEQERENCAALAAFAAEELGCTDPDGLSASLFRIRQEARRRAVAEQIEQLASRSIAEAFWKFGLPADHETLHRAEAVFFATEVERSRLYSDAEKVLGALADLGLRRAMISNASSHQVVVDIVSHVGIRTHFDPLVTSAAFGPPKPHAAIFWYVLDAWRIPAASAVMVGDSLGADILGGRNVGIRTILVNIEPNPDNQKLAAIVTPSARVAGLQELLDVLRRWTTA